MSITTTQFTFYVNCVIIFIARSYFFPISTLGLDYKPNLEEFFYESRNTQYERTGTSSSE